MGVLPQLVTDSTLVISDALNHNSIITAIRLSQPVKKAVYAHLDMQTLDTLLASNPRYSPCSPFLIFTTPVIGAEVSSCGEREGEPCRTRKRENSKK